MEWVRTLREWMERQVYGGRFGHRKFGGAGILGISVYFPRYAVDQGQLEEFDGVSPGKYTIGFGQRRMAVPSDLEDVTSMAMTVLQRLVEGYGLSYSDIGRLEVGTESGCDRSKSVKSSLMQLFAESGNFEVEGLDTVNACYGGTAALFNTLAWVESSGWDGRFGVVVAADIAIYAAGPARPTGGCGAAALLIGPNGTLRPEIGLRSTWMENVWDFYKPVTSCSEYPIVNGRETIHCYFRGLDQTYRLFRERCQALDGVSFSLATSVDYALFHSPFNKIVRKALARMYRRDISHKVENGCWVDENGERTTERMFLDVSEPLYLQKCAPGQWFSQEVGNAYTASLYMNLAALVMEKGDKLVGSRICLYSFGSGFASSMFALRVVGSVATIRDHLSPLRTLLEDRPLLSPKEFSRYLEQRESSFYSRHVDWNPCGSVDDLYPGTFYINGHVRNGIRSYCRKV
mmetsp:Transcript_4455/g.8841  ORF Transcript_4455/g.8841 Transcript_4455/m.8841 type:complete len:460 (-) Transcript_4455:985-2364(-)